MLLQDINTGNVTYQSRPSCTHVLYANIDQTLMNSFHRLLNC